MINYILFSIWYSFGVWYYIYEFTKYDSFKTIDIPLALLAGVIGCAGGAMIHLAHNPIKGKLLFKKKSKL